MHKMHWEEEEEEGIEDNLDLAGSVLDVTVEIRLKLGHYDRLMAELRMED